MGRRLYQFCLETGTQKAASHRPNCGFLPSIERCTAADWRTRSSHAKASYIARESEPALSCARISQESEPFVRSSLPFDYLTPKGRQRRAINKPRLPGCLVIRRALRFSVPSLHRKQREVHNPCAIAQTASSLHRLQTDAGAGSGATRSR